MISSLLLLDGGVLPVIAMLAKTTAVIAMGLMAAWLARRSRASVRHSILVVFRRATSAASCLLFCTAAEYPGRRR